MFLPVFSFFRRFCWFEIEDGDKCPENQKDTIGNARRIHKIIESDIGHHKVLLLSSNQNDMKSPSIPKERFFTINSIYPSKGFGNNPGLISTTANHAEDKFMKNDANPSATVFRDGNLITIYDIP